MSTFSSVVNKSGKKFAPKATARRNVPSRPPSSIAPTSLDPPTSTQPVGSSLENVTNSSDASQAQSAIEQDAAASAPGAHVPQSRRTNTSLNILPPEIHPATSPTGTVNVGRPAGQAKRDAVREGWAANQDKVYKERVARRTPKAQPTASNEDDIAYQPPVLDESSHELDTNPEEQAHNPPAASKRSTRSQNGGPKIKSSSLAADAPVVAPGSSVDTSASEKGTSAPGARPRKRQKVDPIRSRPSSVSEMAGGPTTASRVEPIVAVVPSIAVAGMEGEEPITRPSRLKRKKRAKKTMEEVAAEIVVDAAGDTSDANEGSREVVKRRKRQKKPKIPEGAEDHEIAPSEVKMADLIKDKRLGKGSKLEARLEEIDWDEVKKKRKEAQEEAEKQRELEKEAKRTGRPAKQDDVPAAPTVPKMTLRDGRIALEEDSRVVDRHAEIEQAADETVKELDMDDVTRRVNQSTVGRQSGVKRKGHWSEEMTDLFYKGLRMFGTDFMMISKMFPGMSRRHIKLKYTREERTNLARVHNNLVAKEDVDMEEYSLMSNQVYEDHERVYQEIRADEKKLRDEDVARRAHEAEAEQGDVAPEESNVLQSKEQGTAEPAGGDEIETTAPETESSAKENRFDSVARSIVQRATAPKKAKKQPALARKRERKKKTGLEGTEEVVGSIEDIQRR